MRVISLCPSLTETVFRLGRGEALVGRTKFCVQPRGIVESIERVGGTKNPKVERIVALHPDLVLMNEEENRREDAEALTSRGIRILSTFARDVEGAAASIRIIGAAIGAATPADELATRIAERAATVAARAAARPQRPRFVYLIWQHPFMAAGAGTYIDALLSHAGGDNLVAIGGARYPEVDVPTLQRADAVLLASEPFPFAARHRDEIAAATGVPKAMLRLVDGELLSWHGARTFEGLAYAEEVVAAAAGTR